LTINDNCNFCATSYDISSVSRDDPLEDGSYRMWFVRKGNERMNDSLECLSDVAVSPTLKMKLELQRQNFKRISVRGLD
jgi:hypothetical protein